MLIINISKMRPWAVARGLVFMCSNPGFYIRHPDARVFPGVVSSRGIFFRTESVFIHQPLLLSNEILLTNNIIMIIMIIMKKG